VGVRFEKQSEGSQEQALGGAEETEIADLDEAPGQNVLEEAVDELIGGEGAELELAGIGRVVAKGDLVVFELDQTAVADGNPENVGSQVLKGSAAIADRFAVDDPLLLPHIGWEIIGEAGFEEDVLEFCPEDSGDGFHREQEVMVCGQPSAMIGR
jgi:hypothetical protein